MSKNSPFIKIKSLLYGGCVLLAVVLAATCSPAGRNGRLTLRKAFLLRVRKPFRGIRHTCELE